MHIKHISKHRTLCCYIPFCTNTQSEDKFWQDFAKHFFCDFSFIFMAKISVSRTKSCGTAVMASRRRTTRTSMRLACLYSSCCSARVSTCRSASCQRCGVCVALPPTPSASSASRASARASRSSEIKWRRRQVGGERVCSGLM